MAPHDQHSVMMGLEGADTKIPDWSGFCVVAMMFVDQNHTTLKRRSNVCRPPWDSCTIRPTQPTAAGWAEIFRPSGAASSEIPSIAEL